MSKKNLPPNGDYAVLKLIITHRSVAKKIRSPPLLFNSSSGGLFAFTFLITEVSLKVHHKKYQKYLYNSFLGF